MMEQALLFLLLVVTAAVGDDTNARVVEVRCGTEVALNATVFLPSLIANMDGTREQVRAAGFGISTSGADHSLALCYRGLPALGCMPCYSAARTTLPGCFPYIGGRVYLDGCFMRAEKYDFYGEFAGPQDGAVCGNDTRRGARFAAAARRAVAGVAAAASRGGGNATAVVGVEEKGGKVYVLADCWRSVNESGCRACLAKAAVEVGGCLPWSEGRALNTGCFLRYSDTDFLEAADDGGASGGNKMAVVLSSVIVFALVVVAVFAIVLVRIHRKSLNKRRDTKEAENIASLLYKTCVNFQYSTLEKATGSFDDSNKLGQGGFGAVYKGVLADGREIAVKRLFLVKKHNASVFYNEANIISSLEHKNLVRLLGCSCSGPESLLVYEFLPNKSLNRLLFDPERGKELTWEKRFGIILGIAEGLIYLHENPKMRIIHRDIKAGNILLDSQLRAKIADFGLARSFQDDKTHISTAVAGTIGYLAPEYIVHGQLTEKADVYSFGVLLLEIVNGTPNNRRHTESSYNLLISAWKHFQMRRTEELIDPNALPPSGLDCEDGLKGEILRVVHVAHLCTQEHPSLRPSASLALRMLLGEEGPLPAPTRPPFVDDDIVGSSNVINYEDTPQRDACANSSLSSSSAAVVSYSSLLPR